MAEKPRAADAEPPDDALLKTIGRLQLLTSAQFYGSVEIKFESGKVVLIRQSETIKV